MRSGDRGASLTERFLETAGSLLGLMILCFVLLKLLPGSPFDEETFINPAVRDSVSRVWGLHDPLYRQLFAYLKSVLIGDWGVSMTYPDKTVMSLLRQGLTNTLTLNVLAVAVIYALAFISAIGVRLARGVWVRELYEAVIGALISMPSFLLAPLLVLVFGIQLDWFPVAFLDGPRGYVLPVFALALRPAAYLSRLISRSLEVIESDDYMRTAKAKGLTRAQVLIGHGVKNALAPVLGHSSALMVSVLSGSFIIEVLFALQGLGQIFVDGIGHRDITVVVGFSFFYGATLIVLTLFFDLLQKWVDPRLRGVM